MKKLTLLLLAVLIGEAILFMYKETTDIRIIPVQIKDLALKDVLNGIRVVQISDFHVKKYGSIEKKLLRIIKKISPDVIFVTGDFIESNAGIVPCIRVMKELTGLAVVIGVLGNSDYSNKKKAVDTKRLVDEMRTCGVKLLINESVRLIAKDAKHDKKKVLYIVGLNDNYLWKDDIFKAMRNVPVKGTKILLAHSPNIIEKINTEGINLILTGHTHGGQIVMPVFGALYLNPVCNARKLYKSGFYQEDTPLYVNRGIGTSLISLRMFCKPEVTLFTFY